MRSAGAFGCVGRHGMSFAERPKVLLGSIHTSGTPLRRQTQRRDGKPARKTTGAKVATRTARRLATGSVRCNECCNEHCGSRGALYWLGTCRRGMRHGAHNSEACLHPSCYAPPPVLGLHVEPKDRRQCMLRNRVRWGCCGGLLLLLRGAHATSCTAPPTCNGQGCRNRIFMTQPSTSSD